MDTDAKGQLGGIECSKEAREKMAKDSRVWKCPACAKSNADIMQEREDLVRESQGADGKRKEEEIPEELRLAYRDELGTKGGENSGQGKGKANVVDAAPASLPAATSTSPVAAPAPSTTNSAVTATSTQPKPPVPRAARSTTVQQTTPPSPDRAMTLIDMFIYGIVAALLFMVLRRFV